MIKKERFTNENNKKIIVSLSLILTLIFSTQISTYAYTTWNYGFYQKSINITNGLLYSEYVPLLNLAMSDWNNASTGRTIKLGSPAQSVVTGSYGDDFLGQYAVVTKNDALTKNRTTSFQIRLNHSRLGGESASFKRSTIAHEIGHAYGLDHVSDSETSKLMCNNRNRNNIFFPTADEVSGAKIICP